MACLKLIYAAIKNSPLNPKLETIKFCPTHFSIPIDAHARSSLVFGLDCLANPAMNNAIKQFSSLQQN